MLMPMAPLVPQSSRQKTRPKSELSSPEVSSCQTSPDGANNNQNSSGYISQPEDSMGRPNCSRLFVKRGSLTISNLPQKFNYRDDSAIPLIKMTLKERDSQETYSRGKSDSNGDLLHGTDSCLQIDCENKTASCNALSSNNDDFMLADDGCGDTVLANGRLNSISASPRTSQASTWRKWVDTTCCFGYIHLRCTWIFHPQGPLSYFWLAIVSIAVLHNIIHIPLRFAFCGWNMNLGLAATTEDIIRGKNISSAIKAIPATFPSRDLAFWMIPDYFFDVIYAVDILKSMRTGFFEEGFMNAHPQAIFTHYVGSACFYADLLSLLPLDFLYLSFGLNSLLRIPRIIKIYRCAEFINWTERHTRWPNVIRSIKLFIYVLLLSHWNAALCKSALHGYETIWFQKESITPRNVTDFETPASSSSRSDLAFYWPWLYVSVSTLCTLGLSGTSGLDYNGPALIFMFLTFQMMLGLVLFAVAIGEILLIVDSLGAGQREFQVHLDAVKNYMEKRDIPKPVRVKIIRWFDYIWESRRGFDEERRHLMIMPECLQADISLHAYLHTLKQVEFFRNTEAGFLKELVLKLKPILFSPGEFVCRKGEIGRSMYIIELGMLKVYNGKHINSTPVAEIKKGQYFGELSLLNMGKAGNRRTATVLSVGYSHLLSLCKDDLFAVLQDFPKERARLEYFAGKRCEQYHQEKIQEKMKRHQSRETLTQLTVNENVDKSTVIASDTMTKVVAEAPTTSTSSNADSDYDTKKKVETWQQETIVKGAETLKEALIFTRSECSLSLPITKPAPSSTSVDNSNRRTSFSTTPDLSSRRRSFVMRENNMNTLMAMARMNNAYTGSPLLSRAAKSTDRISGRESAL